MIAAQARTVARPIASLLALVCPLYYRSIVGFRSMFTSFALPEEAAHSASPRTVSPGTPVKSVPRNGWLLREGLWQEHTSFRVGKASDWESLCTTPEASRLGSATGTAAHGLEGLDSLLYWRGKIVNLTGVIPSISDQMGTGESHKSSCGYQRPPH